MPRTKDSKTGRNKLTATRIKNAPRPSKLGDGDGLWLYTSAKGAQSWVFIYIRNGRRREMGLGPYGRGTGSVPLPIAREKADEIRNQLGRGIDPFAERQSRRNAANRATFGEVADALLDSMESGWRNDKHRAQWRMTLGDAYCAGLRKIPVADVTTDDVLAVLKPIWTEKAETASRIRGRIEKVLDRAKAKGQRTGENPARWKGHLDHILPARQKLQRGHHAAMPYKDVPAFMARLAQSSGVGARALEFTILTAARSGEAIGATWDEIDFAAAVWTVPADRMKAGREHRVPLSRAAIAVLERVKKDRIGEFVFAGQSPRKPLSAAAMTKMMRLLKADAYTVHGFRSAFRDWAAEETTHPREVAEAALAHVVGDATERAYRRGDALEKRRKLMGAWARFASAA